MCNIIRILASPMPLTALNTIKKYGLTLAPTGVRRVATAVRNMNQPKTLLPPNLSDSHPPGICVIR